MKKVLIRTCLWLLVLSLMVPAGGFAQDTGSAPPVFRQEELDQMLAPIALYPDSLLIQVLMAATYPLEVVQAARWVNQNPNLKGANLATALDQKYWDPSVKSLVNFPSVLAMMNDKLEWTQNIGDAFLGQKDQVMATVQNLRAKAQAQGTLKTTKEQVVVVREETIVIEPASPQVVYVPAYNPMVVYGPWWYPAYPPYYYYPPGYAVATAGFVSFGVGVACGAAWGYAWGSVNWANHQVYVNPAQNVTINNTFTQNNANVNVNRNVNNTFNQANINAQKTVNSGQGGSGQRTSGQGSTQWQHDPSHRKGVAYKDPSVRQQFGQTGNAGANARKDFRGFDQGSQNLSSGQQRMNTTAGKDSMGPNQQTSGQRKSTSSSNLGGNQQFKGKSTDGAQHMGSTTPQNRSSGAIENFNRSGSDIKHQSDRGRSSRESTPIQKPSQTFQGGKTSQGGGGGFPNIGSSNRSTGGGGATPNIGGSNRSSGGGGTTPKIGGGLPSGGGGLPSGGGGGGGLPGGGGGGGHGGFHR